MKLMGVASNSRRSPAVYPGATGIMRTNCILKLPTCVRAESQEDAAARVPFVQLCGITRCPGMHRIVVSGHVWRTSAFKPTSDAHKIEILRDLLYKGLQCADSFCSDLRVLVLA